MLSAHSVAKPHGGLLVCSEKLQSHVAVANKQTDVDMLETPVASTNFGSITPTYSAVKYIEHFDPTMVTIQQSVLPTNIGKSLVMIFLMDPSQGMKVTKLTFFSHTKVIQPHFLLRFDFPPTQAIHPSQRFQ